MQQSYTKLLLGATGLQEDDNTEERTDKAHQGEYLKSAMNRILER